jgi:DNA (cytosine-5)-methyltransferase 1
MKYLSVCSGIEAATMAWHDLGWKPAGFSEIEPFPSAVLAHHYPDVTNFGDMTKYKEWNLDGSINLLVGGTPCQSFSVAGLRKGMDDPRGNLALVYCGMLDHFRPNWFVWENVPGVLSSSGGRDFGSFLGAVAQLGYGFSYRVLDAQYCGVAQRRRRIFVVGHLGDWRLAAAVLFERHSLRRDLAPSQKQRENLTSATPKSVGALCARDYKGVGNQYVSEGKCIVQEGFDKNGLQTTVGTLCADTHPGSYSGQDAYTGRLIPTVYETHPADSRVKEMGETCQTVTSRWGTGGGNVPLVQEAYSLREDATANTFSATPLKVTPALQALRPSVQSHHAQTFIAEPKLRVRRLTPIECERLQGFPDGFTDIPWRKKDTSPDGLRYKALGNSMAVPVMQWIGDGIDMVSKL